MFLKSISNYRGLAIILIVAGHLYGFGFTGTDAISEVLKNIVTGSTGLFVFISGFMFHHVFYKRYKYNNFMKNKILNIGIPYLIFSTTAIFLLFISNKGYFNSESLIELSEDAYKEGNLFRPTDSNFAVALKYYLTGRFLTAYWYIPFALVLFATAPFHFRYISFSKKTQITIVILLSLISIFAHRPVAGTNPLHSLIYYTPIYLIGILISIYKDEIKSALTGKIIFLFLGVFVFSIIEYLTGHLGNYSKPLFQYDGIDYMYLQKVFLIFLIYMILEVKTFNSKIIDVISETSFAIFFLHPWLIIILQKIFLKLNFMPEEKTNNIFVYIISLILILFISVFIALVVKKIFKGSKKSRYFIGY